MDDLSTSVANDLADAGKQQLQVFVDLSRAADGGPIRSADIFSRDGNRRGNSFDAGCVGFVELLQKLSGVS